jgi:CBS domain-containing protein
MGTTDEGDDDMLNTRQRAEVIGHGPIVTIPDDATLRDAAGLLHGHSIGALAVAGPRGLAGIVSERDIIDAVARRVDLDTARVGDHLTSPVMSARPEDTVLDVALQMLDSGTRHLPLVDDLDRPVAMVSLRDLLRPLVLQSMTPGEDERCMHP